jgi:hypothetical protein
MVVSLSGGMANANLMDDLGNYAGCNRPLIEIDHYGERLIGCVRCNRWGWQPDKPLFMELPEGG